MSFPRLLKVSPISFGYRRVVRSVSSMLLLCFLLISSSSWKLSGEEFSPSDLTLLAATTLRDLESFLPPGPPLPPANDDFENATPLPLLQWSVPVTLDLSTTQPGEPLHGFEATNQSVWFRWTAPWDGEVECWVRGLEVLFEVYQGDSFDDLVPVRNVEGQYATSQARYRCLGLTNYFIQVFRPTYLDSGGDGVTELIGRYLPPQIVWGPNITWTVTAGRRVTLQFQPAEGALLGATSRATLKVGELDLEAPVVPPWEFSFVPEGPGSFTVLGKVELRGGQTIRTPAAQLRVLETNSDWRSPRPLPAGVSTVDASTEFTDTLVGDSSGDRVLWFRWIPTEPSVLWLQPETGMPIARQTLFGLFNHTLMITAPKVTSGVEPSPWVVWKGSAGTQYLLRIATPGPKRNFRFRVATIPIASSYILSQTWRPELQLWQLRVFTPPGIISVPGMEESDNMVEWIPTQVEGDPVAQDQWLFQIPGKVAGPSRFFRTVMR